MKKAKVLRFFVGLLLFGTILMLISVMNYGRFMGFVVSGEGEEITKEFLVRSILVLNVFFVVAYVVWYRRKFRKMTEPRDRRQFIKLDNL